MPQQPWLHREMHPHAVVLQDLERGVPHLGKSLVDEAAHEKGDLEVRGGLARCRARAELLVPGHRGQGFEMPVRPGAAT